MNLLSHYTIELNHNQKEAVDQLSDFLKGNCDVFLLKGFAGTGKTTMIAGLIKALSHEKKKFIVCAPTGRAAKILRNKTGYGSTIHSAIYDFENLETKNSKEVDVAKHSYEYYFPIIQLAEETIVIVDEASMISNNESKHELFTFGSNTLLSDLLTYANLKSESSKNKMIVIGDPAQLPPVGDSHSWALDKSFYEKKDISINEIFLSEVMRQKDNLILENASKIRNCIENELCNNLEFNFDEKTFINFNGKNVVKKYCELYPIPSFNNGVIITYSNAQNLHYNQEIRDTLFPFATCITEGDIIQIINNNYHNYKTEIFNGDFAQVIKIGETVNQSAPVMVDQGGEKIRKIITLKFRKIIFRLPDVEEDIEAYINETLLESTNRDLSINEMKALYINTIIRFQKVYPQEQIKSELFKSFLKNDEFFNSLRVKYGYSITGHKSQGGEWKTIFVDYYGKVSLKKDPLRWSYTATTRASEILYAINFPDFGKYYKLKFSEIEILGKMPKDALIFLNVPKSPYHTKENHKCKSWLYWNVMDRCENSMLKIKNIDSYEWLEKYTFLIGDEILKAETHHNGAGYFAKGFVITENPSTINNDIILEILDGQNKVVFPNTYTPSEKYFEHLFTIVQAASIDAEIRITNVVEKSDSYFVSYYFETDNPISYIQFYFDKNNVFSKAIVKTFGIENDKKLVHLISNITEYATISED